MVARRRAYESQCGDLIGFGDECFVDNDWSSGHAVCRSDSRADSSCGFVARMAKLVAGVGNSTVLCVA